MPNEEAFYVSESDGVFIPTRATVGPWDSSLQHGGPGAALLGRALESLGDRGDVRVAHFSLDFLGPLALRPMTVRAEIVRPGKRIELATATAEIDGRVALRASAWRIAVGADRSARVAIAETVSPLPLHESQACTRSPRSQATASVRRARASSTKTESSAKRCNRSSSRAADLSGIGRSHRSVTGG
jgi:hypothetical protein